MHRRHNDWRSRHWGTPIRPIPHVPSVRIPSIRVPPVHIPSVRIPPIHGMPPPRLRRVHRRRIPFPLLLVGGVVGVSVLFAVIAAVFAMAMVVGAVAVPALIAIGITRSVRNGRRRHLSGPHHGTVRSGRRPMPLAQPPAADPWPAAKHRFAVLRSEYGAYECDALAVLRLPALADVTVPSTARFIEAFAEAQALDADGPVPPAQKAQFVAAVDKACRAWTAAREAAERIRLSALPPEERSTVERVIRLLTTARDSDNDAERLVAYGKARTELARLERTGHIHIPRPAQAQLDNAYRGQLPS